MKPVLVIGIIGIIITGILVTVNFQSEQNIQNTPNQINEIVIGVEGSILPSVVWIAEANQYFEDEGLNVTIKEFDSGRNALNAMLSGQDLNMVTVAQTPVVLNSFDRSDYVIVASMARSSNDVKLLASGDSDIETAQDLNGKKIGVTVGSTGQYFLEVFLSEHNIFTSDVDIIDIDASKLPSAIKEKQVDAIATWEPHIFDTQNMLSGDSILFTSSFFMEEFYFVASDDFQKNKPAIKKFLTATIRAEDFIKNNPHESQKIISDRLELDEQFINSVWNDFEFRISLEQSTLSSLEKEARWAMISGHSNGVKDKPNYLEYINFEILAELDTKLVEIVR